MIESSVTGLMLAIMTYARILKRALDFARLWVNSLEFTNHGFRSLDSDVQIVFARIEYDVNRSAHQPHEGKLPVSMFGQVGSVKHANCDFYSVHIDLQFLLNVKFQNTSVSRRLFRSARARCLRTRNQ